MVICDENIMVAARAARQVDHIKGVFDEMKSGIFYHVTEANYRAAESRLNNIFNNRC